MLSCTTNGMFLEWNITAGKYSRLRLISSSETRDIPPLSVNHTALRFVHESREPLNITLFIINATADWQISCTEYLSSTQNKLETTVHIITMAHINSKYRSVPGKHPWVLKHNSRFWPAWALTQDINSMFVWKLQQ